jgi:hypothetical protein
MCFSVRLRAAAGAERSCFGAVGHGDRDGARSFVFALAAPGDGGRAGAWGRVGEVSSLSARMTVPRPAPDSAISVRIDG